MSIPVLMYHAVENAQHPSVYQSPEDRIYAVTEAQFKQQMQYLRDHGFTPLLLHEVAHSRAAKKIVISFDDGHASDVAVALPILQEFGFRAEFYVTTDWIDTSGFVSEKDITTLISAGMIVGSHGQSHRFFDEMSEQEALNELQCSLERLQSIGGFPIDRFSAPGGREHPRQQAFGEQLGVSYLLGSRVDLWNGGCASAIPRVAVQQDTTLEVFARICEGDEHFFRRARLRYSLLLAAKRLLGNKRYQQFRAKFF